MYTRTSVCVRQHTLDVRGRPSAHTGRPWPSVSTQTAAGTVLSTQIKHAPWLSRVFGPRGLSVQCNTQDVLQHKHDVVAGRCVSVCPQCTRDVRHAHSMTSVITKKTQTAWLSSLCVRVSVSAHRTIRQQTQTSVHQTRRTSVQHKEKERPWACPWCVPLSVKCTNNAGRLQYHRTSVSTQRNSVPSSYTEARPWPSVSNTNQEVSRSKQITSLARPSTHTGRPSVNILRPCPRSVQHTQQDVPSVTEDIPGLPYSTHRRRNFSN
ncbi:hypothetical protein IGI04_043082 [Brassica rapa subsp. trilocularis]|uniref:Uncharacterized protein n=1 Tax=Brassica rapa subsp. trilocularis TaxID=1813537 RepID=A0ABQ7KJ93_BRACM|nr:hypothetical protein IGI04_043082 [Brassica rapa subsp. trilocularis]